MGSSTSRAIRRRRPATRTGWRPRCAFQTLDSLPLRSTEDQYFSLRGGAERQGHESELDEPTAVGAASDPTKEGRAGSPPALRRVITLRHAVAIYVSSLLGSGIFVVPGLAARIAGPASIVTAAALIVWSYLGYENTSNVAEEFRDPERDFHRSVVISVILISGLYLAVAFVTVGTGAYLIGGGVTPFAAMMSDAFGTYGGAIVALLAVFVTFGTVNAYVAGMARVYYAAARDGVFPKMLAAVDRRTGVPHHALVFLIVLVLVGLLAFYVLDVDFVSAFLMASGAAILTYVIGSVAGIRLLNERGIRRVLPWISLLVSLALLPFIGALLAASVAIAGIGLLASWVLSHRERGAIPGT